MARIVIVGAGISGLAAALHIEKDIPSADVTVLEAGPRIGGTIWTERADGFQVEYGPNGFLDSKPSTLELCRALQLDAELIPAAEAARHRFLWLNDRLQALPEGFWSFLGSPLLSWRAKCALLLERFQKPRPADLGEESVHDFVKRRTCAEIADLFADALVTGIHAGDPHLLSMAAAFPRVWAMEREHGSVTAGLKQAARQRRREARQRGETLQRGSRTMSLRPGLRLLVERIAERLRKPPVVGVAVRRLQFQSATKPAWKVEADGRENWPADVVVLACPAHQQARILAELDPPLADLMQQIPYSPAVVVALGFRQADLPRPLPGFGYIAPQGTRGDVLGSQWCSTIFPERAPPGHVLLRAIAGGWHRRDIVDWDDARLLESVRLHYRQALGVEAGPVFHRIIRWPAAIPQYHLGHLQRVLRIEERVRMHPGLIITGNAFHGVALNDCTEQAALISQRVAARLAERG